MRSAPARPIDLHLHGRWFLHIHCIWSVPNKDSVFTRNWISSFLYRDRMLQDQIKGLGVTVPSLHRYWFPGAGVSNPAPGELLSYRFKLQTHLSQLIKVFKATCSFQTGVLEQAWNWNLQDGSSPGAGLEILALVSSWRKRATIRLYHQDTSSVMYLSITGCFGHLSQDTLCWGRPTTGWSGPGVCHMVSCSP